MVLAAKWTRIALNSSAPPLKLSSHSLAVVGSKAYLFGGELKPRTPVSGDVVEIDLESGNVRTISPPPSSSSITWPSPRVGAALTTTPSHPNSIFLFGGRGGKAMGVFDVNEEDLWKFDVEEEVWERVETKGEKPEQRSFHVLSGLEDRLYLHAGCPPSGRLSTLHSLDLSTSTWSQLPSAPGPGRGGTVLAPTSSPTPSLLRFGGFAGHELGGPLVVFDPAKGEWEEREVKGEEPGKRSVHGFFSVEGKRGVEAVLVMGEREGAPAELGHDGAGAFHSDAWALVSSSASSTESPSSYSWVHLPYSTSTGSSSPEARGWFASSKWGKDKIVVHGGLNEKNERLDDLWVLEVVEG